MRHRHLAAALPVASPAARELQKAEIAASPAATDFLRQLSLFVATAAGQLH